MTKASSANPPAKPVQRRTIQSNVVKPSNDGQLAHIGGSKSDDWNNILVNQAFDTLWLANSDEEQKGRQYNAAVAYMMQMKPADELEAMMAAQLFAAHNAAMECYRRAMIKEQSAEARGMNLAQANKLSRTYATLIEALNRHRGKGGQQKVTVKHVHVHEGGQAAIGNFSSPGGGGGVATNSKGQPHAKPNADAPEPALLRSDPLGNVLPISGDAELPLSHARRKEPRRA
ncbi:hypothetical protein [Bosea caraganae]|uniref:hypothetical protein n=1 Tax=Bosea caraganae TaxID=2763117 RepID=UPI0015F09F87|nr:hypothetical protein [Bosea caraganae]